jgi:exodeoxyribonuclease VII large subunit
MSRKAQSQWDFGELFPTEQIRQVLTVTELTTKVRRLIEKEVGQIWVTGEVTNLRIQASGHAYFTIKDGGAQLNCVLFRGEAAANREFLQDGQKLILQGDLTVYEARGQYQLIVHAIEPQGIGALQVAFEKLKRKLQAEGLFAQERKRSLPHFPQRIGLVTSPTGAAIRDVLHVIERRQPSLEIILVPCRVQGEGAAAEIADAIRMLNKWNEQASPAEGLDLILLTRGGGSLEDLWAFNEEVVGRAVFESALPVVSAVGHEIDFTISDFVADLRAATPSAAAEIITEGAFASRRLVAEALPRLRQLILDRLDLEQRNLTQMVQRLSRVHPRRKLQEQSQYLDDLQGSLQRSLQLGLRQHRTAWSNLRLRLSRLKPSMLLAQRRQSVQDFEEHLRERACHALQAKRNGLANLTARLQLLGPDNVLARGYSITIDATTGAIVRTAGETKPGQRLKTLLKSGQVRSVVEG